jgi:hypothetical protein
VISHFASGGDGGIASPSGPAGGAEGGDRGEGLRRIKKKLTRYTLFLHSVLSKLSARGLTFNSCRDLLVQLDFNGYFSSSLAESGEGGGMGGI